MDAGQILGAILGRKSGSGGSGGNILKDILGGAMKRTPSSPSATQTQRQPRVQNAPATPSSSGGGGGLQDLIREAYEKFGNRSGSGGRTSTGGRTSSGGFGSSSSSKSKDVHCNDPKHGSFGTSQRSELDNDRAVLLIRAMINAAKADGQLDSQEQDAIVGQLGDVTQEEVDFLKKEFAAPLDVRDFAWSVPLGQEEQVYGMSLMGMKLDQNKEAHYLKELAHGLRLRPEECNAIHNQYGAPRIF